MLEWSACTQEPNGILRWIECHPGTASWMQAVFSVIAIVAAGTISLVLTNSDRIFRAKERTARSENLLVTVAGDFMPLYGAIQRLQLDIARMHDRPPTVGNTQDHLTRIRLAISPRLNDAILLAIDMDTAIVDPLRQTIMTATAYNAFLGDLITAWPFDPAEWPNVMDNLEATRKRAEDFARLLFDQYQNKASKN